MGTSHFILIFVAEALAVCLFIIGLVLLKNRKLRNLITQLQARLKELAANQKNAVIPPPAPPQPELSYSDRLDEQLAATKEHHDSLDSHQDIALDLDPDSPLARRTAALRYALLVAEREATADAQTNWEILASRYQQLLSFNEDYAPQTDATDTQPQEDLDQIKDELQQAKKRITNLERFKAMYFELEELWEKCKDKADEHYNELRSMAAKTEQPEDFTSLLEQYHSSYAEFGETLEAGGQESAVGAPADSQLHELRRLRSVAADQHRIISELQHQLNTSSAAEEKAVIVESLQIELSKQARFLKESETCIQLMEDELASANNQLLQLRDKANRAAQLKSEVNRLKKASDDHEKTVESLQQENRRLAKKIKLAQEAPPEDNQEARALRKQVNALQSKYNDLEEKFLNLKLKE